MSGPKFDAVRLEMQRQAQLKMERELRKAEYAKLLNAHYECDLAVAQICADCSERLKKYSQIEALKYACKDIDDCHQDAVKKLKACMAKVLPNELKHAEYMETIQKNTRMIRSQVNSIQVEYERNVAESMRSIDAYCAFAVLADNHTTVKREEIPGRRFGGRDRPMPQPETVHTDGCVPIDRYVTILNTANRLLCEDNFFEGNRNSIIQAIRVLDDVAKEGDSKAIHQKLDDLVNLCCDVEKEREAYQNYINTLAYQAQHDGYKPRVPKMDAFRSVVDLQNAQRRLDHEIDSLEDESYIQIQIAEVLHELGYRQVEPLNLHRPSQEEFIALSPNDDATVALHYSLSDDATAMMMEVASIAIPDHAKRSMGNTGMHTMQSGGRDRNRQISFCETHQRICEKLGERGVIIRTEEDTPAGEKESTIRLETVSSTLARALVRQAGEREEEPTAVPEAIALEMEVWR